MPDRTTGQGFQRVRRVLSRARAAQRRRDRGRRPSGRLLTGAVCLLAGLMIVISGVNARGTDLRPGRNTDLVSLVQAQARRNAELTRQLTSLRAEVDVLTAAENVPTSPDLTLSEQARRAGLTAVTGPAVSVTLDDAPAEIGSDGIDADLLVVHQQDIQAVVNVLWAGGAEAMTIQGQRVISTTGVKCVGNTVVLHGIPYAPPYVIRAMGNPERLRGALAEAEPIRIYKQYVEAYGLVYQEEWLAATTFPAHEGTTDLEHAEPVR